MVFRFRFRAALFPVQKIELTSRLFSDFVDFWREVALGRWLRHSVIVGLTAIALWCGTAIPAPVAHAAATPEAEANGFSSTTTSKFSCRSLREPHAYRNFLD